MKRAFLAIALLLAALASPAAAHHVDVAVAITDQEARVTFISEYVEQRTAIAEAVSLYFGAKSAPEKQDASLALEAGLTASLDHLRSLDVRPCFVPVVDAAINEFTDAAAYFAALRADERSVAEIALKSANEGSALMNNARFHALFDCTEDEVTV